MSSSLLYLDYDGVLHYHDVRVHPLIGPYLSAAPDGAVLFQHLDVLRELLTPYPHVQIILSTSWAKRYGLAKAKKQLHPDMRERVIGSVYRPAMTEAWLRTVPRGELVLADVERRKTDTWLAFDDDGAGWPPEHLSHLVLLDKNEGLGSQTAITKAKAALKATFTL